jgi:hypothetical protein
MQEVWRLYRGRGDAENRIKELKYDFAVDSFNVKEFYATEATLNFVMMAYNLLSLFRQLVLRGTTQSTLKTLRYRVFGIGAYTIQNGNHRILKLALAMKRREWFQGLWKHSDDFVLPCTLSP